MSFLHATAAPARDSRDNRSESSRGGSRSGGNRGGSSGNRSGGRGGGEIELS